MFRGCCGVSFFTSFGPVRASAPVMFDARDVLFQVPVDEEPAGGARHQDRGHEMATVFRMRCLGTRSRCRGVSDKGRFQR